MEVGKYYIETSYVFDEVGYYPYFFVKQRTEVNGKPVLKVVRVFGPKIGVIYIDIKEKESVKEVSRYEFLKEAEKAKSLIDIEIGL